jgi:hypothetical protein
MAKDSDKKAAALEAEKTGKLSGLLADEKEFDRRILWRIGWWGTAAIGTVVVAVLANQGAQSWRRDRISAAELARQAQLLQSLARDRQNETRQLTAAIETLNNDRDRLYARVTVLEQGLDSVTGALAKQGSAQAVGKPQATTAQAWPPTPAQAATQMATADPQASSASQSGQASGATGAISGISASGVSSVATTNATGSDRSRADAGKPGGASPTQPSPTMLSAMAAAPAPSSQPSSAASLFAPKSIMAAPDPAASTKLAEPDKTAKSDASDPEAKSDAKAESKPDGAQQTEANAGATASNEAVPAPVQKTEFAVDLGTANSVNGLRALWRGLAKANNELATLSPIIMVKEGNTGLGMQLRLGAGPLNDAAAAARICASLAERQRPCETTVYDGQRLATRENEAGSEPGKPTASGQKPAATGNAATGTPPNQHRRVWPQQRHGAVREPQPAPPPAAAAPAAEPPKPEPNTLSSLFHRQQPQQ